MSDRKSNFLITLVFDENQDMRKQINTELAFKEQVIKDLQHLVIGKEIKHFVVADDEIINKKLIEERKVGKWEYRQLGCRKYGLVCTSCGYAIHLGYDFTSMKEFKDMVERKLQNPHITMDRFCLKCGAEMRGNEIEIN